MLQFEELLHLLLRHLVAIEFHDVGVTEVDHIHGESIDQSLVVGVHGPLWESEERVLTDVVLEPEVTPLLRITIMEGILRREQVTRQRLIPILRRVVQALHHMSLLGLMSKDSASRLILVHKGQLTTSLIEEDLLNHAIGAPRISHGPVKNNEPNGDHDGQHDRVCPIERVLFYQYSEDCHGHKEPHIEQWDCVPCLSMQVEDEEAVF